MAYLPRGISPELLLSQVKNTMPYLFDSDVTESSLGSFVPTVVVTSYARDLARATSEGGSEPSLNHFDYFRLCLSAHYLTCATPVPTDVDNQIRFKLWPAHLPLEVALQMSQWVLESRSWDFTQVSRRFTYGAPSSPWHSETVGGHAGEWFTVAAAAYCALQQYSDSLAQDQRQLLFESIADEVRRHSEIFGSLWRAKAGLECLKASAHLAHNLGDLDRVMDMWDLGVGDPLRLEFYKLGVTPLDSNQKLRYLGRLWVAGELYKSTIQGSSMALENHRHFALRKPRCLRQNRSYLIPNGPFFDLWGREVARGLMNADGKPSENTFEVVEALMSGWERLPKTVGYGRALRGILEVHPDLFSLLSIPRVTKLPGYRSFLEIPQEVFEKKWEEEALQQMDEIPSRA